MKKFITLIFMSFCAYLVCMNSTENRQRITDENQLGYTHFRQQYLKYIGSSSDRMINRCYAVYHALIDMRPVSDLCDPDIKRNLVKMKICDLDEGNLVLKGFHIEDSLRVLVGSSKKWVNK